MSDDADIDALNAGDYDLARRDFRKAKLTNLQLINRDFTGAHLEQSDLSFSNLSGSIFKEAQFNQITARSANFEGTKLPRVFVSCDFTEAQMQNADFNRAHMLKTKFNGANLIGADFRRSRIQDGCDFTGAITDVTTAFDEAHIFRPLASQPAFRLYRVDRGVLIRKTEDEIRTGISTSLRSEQHDVVRVIDEALQTLGRLTPQSPHRDAQPAGLGHNNPPPLTAEEAAALKQILAELRAETLREKLEPTQIAQKTKDIGPIAAKISDWVTPFAKTVLDEGAKQIGKTLFDFRVWIAGWFMLTGQLGQLVEKVGILMRSLGH